MATKTEKILIVALVVQSLSPIFQHLYVIPIEDNLSQNQELITENQINISNILSISNAESIALMDSHLDYMLEKNNSNKNKLRINDIKYKSNNINYIELLLKNSNDIKEHNAVISKENRDKDKYLSWISILDLLAFFFVIWALWIEAKEHITK